MPPTRRKLACAETSLITSKSMPRPSYRRVHHLRCSIDLPSWRRPGVLDCSGRSVYDGNLVGTPGTSLGRWTICDLFSKREKRKASTRCQLTLERDVARRCATAIEAYAGDDKVSWLKRP